MFDLNHVATVYSGRKGCACGCRGKYSYASAFACDRLSYYVDNDGVNDRSVRTIANKVAALLADPNSDVARVHVGADIHDRPYVAVDMANDRTYTVYFH